MHELKKYLLLPLILIGALNWGIIGLFNYDFLAAIFGRSEMLLRAIDSAIGIAAVIFIVIIFTKKEEK